MLQTIGQLAKASGVGVDTLRDDERIGLVVPACECPILTRFRVEAADECGG